MKETLSVFFFFKGEGPDLKEFAKNMCAIAVRLWWESKRMTYYSMKT